MFLSVLLVFSWGSRSLGFYSDDVAFLQGSYSIPQMVEKAFSYVPGRNLHIVWQQLVFFICGGSEPRALGNIHFLQAIVDAMNVVLVFGVLRTASIPRLWSVLLSFVFAFFPNHMETHFWISSLPMNLVSTMFFLAFLLLSMKIISAGNMVKNNAAFRVLLGIQFVLFFCALFTYEQMFFLIFSICILQFALLRVNTPRGTLIIAAVPYSFVAAGYVFLKMNVSAMAVVTGPSIQFSFHTVRTNLFVALNNMFQPFTEANARLFRADFWADPKHVLAACTILAASVVLSIVMMLLQKNDGPVPSERSKNTVLRFVFIAALGACICILAYLPNLFWSIAPRHNYLPSLGITIILASIAALIHHAARSVGHIAYYAAQYGLTVILSLLMSYFFIQTYTHKNEWIEAYQLKKNLYTDIASHYDLAHIDFLALHNFPRVHKNVPLFDYENGDAIRYFTGRDILPLGFETCSLDTKTGHYAFISEWKHGISGIRYFEKGKVLKLIFAGYKDRYHFSYFPLTDAAASYNFYADNYYAVSETGTGPRDSSARNTRLHAGSFSTVNTLPVLHISIDTTGCISNKGEQLGILLCESHDKGASFRVFSAPVPFRTNDINVYSLIDRTAIVPISLPHRDSGAVTTYSIILKKVLPADAYKVSLYRFSTAPPVLLDERIYSNKN